MTAGGAGSWNKSRCVPFPRLHVIVRFHALGFSSLIEMRTGLPAAPTTSGRIRGSASDARPVKGARKLRWTYAQRYFPHVIVVPPIIGKHTISTAVARVHTRGKRTVYQSRLIKLAECPVITCERAIHQPGQNS